mmetsp:Transcript_42054/g.66727  ORF Transcript_42054/g.66727 Transcript_42054/m.66727 type:complete len:220 (-) Transcript_42054:488-1147(-)
MEGRRWHPRWQLHDAPRRSVFESDLIDRGQQRQLVAEIVLLHHWPDLLRCKGALQLLTTQELFLDLLPAFGAFGLHKGFGAFAVPAAEASCNQIRHATAFQEGRILHLRVEVPDESLHLLQTNSDQRRLGVASIVQAIAKACAQRDHVFQGTTEFDSWNVVHCGDTEGAAIKQLHQHLHVRLVLEPQGRFAEFPGSHFVGHVGAHEHSNLVTQELSQQV